MTEAELNWKLVANDLASTLINLLAGADELDRCANPETWAEAEEKLEKYYNFAQPRTVNNHEQDRDNEAEARRLWNNGVRPGFSTGTCGHLTCGYGKLDQYGYWQYPLYPAEQYLEQGEFKNVSL
jgi:hypothetical protein